MNEFEIIDRYFKQVHLSSQDDLVLGIGDDAAIIQIPENNELLVSTDTLVSGVHFFESTSPEDIGYKSLAVNLSDIAAMGGMPRWVSLSLTLPDNDIDWIAKLSNSFNQLAGEHNLVLIGGDITKGPLSISVTIQGIAPKGKALRRSDACVGDAIYVTGQLGAAAYALSHIKDSSSFVSIEDYELKRLHRPEPRIKTGIALRDIATSCIDISDGLHADLIHILKSSGVGAEINLSSIPFSESLNKLEKDLAINMALTGGDDYELCFTLPAGIPDTSINKLAEICPITCIGEIKSENSELELIDDNGELYTVTDEAYRHF